MEDELPTRLRYARRKPRPRDIRGDHFRFDSKWPLPPNIRATFTESHRRSQESLLEAVEMIDVVMNPRRPTESVALGRRGCRHTPRFGVGDPWAPTQELCRNAQCSSHPRHSCAFQRPSCQISQRNDLVSNSNCSSVLFFAQHGSTCVIAEVRCIRKTVLYPFPSVSFKQIRLQPGPK